MLNERELALVRYALDRFRNEAGWRGALGSGNNFGMITAAERRQIGDEARHRVDKEHKRIDAANAAVPMHPSAVVKHRLPA